MKIFLAALVAMSPLVGAAASPPAVPREVLVKVKAGAQANDIVGIEIAAGAARSSRHLADVQGGHLRVLEVRGNEDDAIHALSGNAHVEYAERNWIVHATAAPNDPRYGELYGLNNTGQSVGTSGPGAAGADIRAQDAWGVTTGSSTVVVGVVDTGIDYKHPDLAANVWSNPGGINGCATGTHGYNAITNSCDPNDDQYHGTHCSGTIGAVGNNGIGVVGVNWTTRLMGLKFLDSTGSGTTANAISAIDFAVKAKIAGVNLRILSNSWGGGGFSQALLDEINKANANDILFVAAAGNNAVDNDTTPHYPSSYSTPNMIAVAATDNTDALATFSNWGATSVHLGAPGVDILSTQPGGLYQYLSGTSMATPHVAGAAALILSRTALTTAQLKSAILNNVDPDAALAGLTVTGGRLNVCRAIPGCVVTVLPPPPPSPGQ